MLKPLLPWLATPLRDYVSERLGFELFQDATRLRSAIQLVETRNLIVHNRGVVNRIFLDRVQDVEASELTLGATIELSVSRFAREVGTLVGSVFDIDARAIAKWGLPTAPMPLIVRGDEA